MRRLLAIVLSLFLLIGASVTQVSAQSTADVNASLDELFGGHKPYQAFFEKLKTAVAADDKEAVASMVDYPFQAHFKGKAVKIRDQKHFVADYDQIITPKVKKAVAKQTYATLFANSQGVMIGDGEVWFGGICSDNTCKQQVVRIIGINY